MNAAVTSPTSARSVSGWGHTPLRYLLLSLYWLPVSLFWGMMLGSLLPARVEDFAGPLHKGTYLGIIAPLGAAASAIIQLVIGPISDTWQARWGRRRPFLLWGTLGAVAAMLAFGQAQSFPGLVIAFFFVQLLLNTANGPYQANIPDHVPPKHQGIASSYMGMMQLLGDAGGPVLAGIALSKAAKALDPAAAKIAAIQHLLWLDAGLLIVFMLLTILFVPDAPSEEKRTVREAVGSLTQVRVRQYPDFFRLLVSRAVYNLGFYIALDFLLYYVQDSLHRGVHYADTLRNLQIITIGAALLVVFPAGALADKVSKKRVIFASCAFSGLAATAFALATHVGFAYAMAICFGLGMGIFRAVDWAFACNLLPQEGGAAKYLAIWSLSATLPQVFAPSFGPIADLINRTIGPGMGWRAAMLMATVCIVIGAAVLKGVHEKPVALRNENSLIEGVV